MTTSPNSASVNISAQADPISIRRQAAIFLIIEFLLIFAPLIILGAAINWPASLDEPASVNLPLILDKYMAMMTGYSICLVYSLLFWPMAYLTGRAIVIGGADNTLFRVASGFAALSVLSRVLGIVRWLFAMPVLASLYTNPAVSGNFKESISMVYEMLNAYAGFPHSRVSRQKTEEVNMNRRTFIRLIGGGVVFSATAGLSACSSEMPPPPLSGARPGWVSSCS